MEDSPVCRMRGCGRAYTGFDPALASVGGPRRNPDEQTVGVAAGAAVRGRRTRSPTHAPTTTTHTRVRFDVAEWESTR